MSERQKIFDEVATELNTNAAVWGDEFDDKNTANDWVAYIAKYTGQAVTLPFDRERFEEQMKKVAGLAVSAIAASRRGGPAKRHYD